MQFFPEQSTGKTEVLEVSSVGTILGKIKWYAPWRRYCFYPAGANYQTIFDVQCLGEITAKINELMDARKEQKKNANATSA